MIGSMTPPLCQSAVVVVVGVVVVVKVVVYIRIHARIAHEKQKSQPALVVVVIKMNVA